jgi:hypothetical protein
MYYDMNQTALIVLTTQLDIRTFYDIPKDTVSKLRWDMCSRLNTR